MTANTAEYMRRYRAEHPDYVASNRARGLARNRALEVLALSHADEFNRTWDAELERVEAERLTGAAKGGHA